MAEGLNFDPSEITATLEKNLASFDSDVSAKTVGRVVEVGDGIARVSGLPDAAMAGVLGGNGALRNSNTAFKKPRPA